MTPPEMGFVGKATVGIALAFTALLFPAASEATSVLYVGDTVGAATAPALARQLPSLRLVDATGAERSTEMVRALRREFEPTDRVVVFDGGNDSSEDDFELRSSLQEAAGVVGDACLVVPTVHALASKRAENYENKTQGIFEFAESRPETQVPEWAGAADLKPHLLRPDGVHPTPRGARFRAALIAEKVRACLLPEEEAARPRPQRIGPSPSLEGATQRVYRDIGGRLLQLVLAVGLVRAAV